MASYVDADGDPAQRSVDVSHRGGKPGFVRIDGDVLTIPDFAGNLHFNTLGNLLVNPRAGLLFIDFATGDLLQLSGTTGLVLDGDEVAELPGRPAALAPARGAGRAAPGCAGVALGVRLVLTAAGVDGQLAGYRRRSGVTA